MGTQSLPISFMRWKRRTKRTLIDCITWTDRCIRIYERNSRSTGNIIFRRKLLLYYLQALVIICFAIITSIKYSKLIMENLQTFGNLLFFLCFFVWFFFQKVVCYRIQLNCYDETENKRKLCRIFTHLERIFLGAIV